MQSLLNLNDMKEQVVESVNYNSRPNTLFDTFTNQRAVLLSNKLNYPKFIKS